MKERIISVRLTTEEYDALKSLATENESMSDVIRKLIKQKKEKTAMLDKIYPMPIRPQTYGTATNTYTDAVWFKYNTYTGGDK